MIRVLVLGQPFWGSHIARVLNAHAADVRATFVSQGRYVRLLATPPRLERVVIMRAGYRIGATTARGQLFDWYWSLLRRLLPAAARCHYWLGTDVLNTVEEAQAGTLRWAALLSAEQDLHLAGAPWLVAELETVGLRATYVPIPERFRAPRVVAPMPSEFRVLTYLPADRFDFYGGPVILEAARRLPDVRFDIVGRRIESARSAPENVRWHGWVADMEQRYTDTSVVIRIPRHDGLGGTVVEGLLHARHVVYTYEVPFVRRVPVATPEALVAVLTELHDGYVAGQLTPNLAGRTYALEEFDEARLAGNLISLVRARV